MSDRLRKIYAGTPHCPILVEISAPNQERFDDVQKRIADKIRFAIAEIMDAEGYSNHGYDGLNPASVTAAYLNAEDFAKTQEGLRFDHRQIDWRTVGNTPQLFAPASAYGTDLNDQQVPGFEDVHDRLRQLAEQ